MKMLKRLNRVIGDYLYYAFDKFTDYFPLFIACVVIAIIIFALKVAYYG